MINREGKGTEDRIGKEKREEERREGKEEGHAVQIGKMVGEDHVRRIKDEKKEEGKSDG